jgi:hypothetical protein
MLAGVAGGGAPIAPLAPDPAAATESDETVGAAVRQRFVGRAVLAHAFDRSAASPSAPALATGEG